MFQADTIHHFPSVKHKENLINCTFSTFTQPLPFPSFHVKQVHGQDVIEINPLRHSPAFPPYGPVAEADGMVYFFKSIKSNEEKVFSLPLVIKTADCLPIVLLGHQGVIHLHAGWRGLAAGNEILRHPKIKEIEPFFILVGPSIQACCYEVGEEFKQHFPYSIHLSASAPYFFDLAAEAISQLEQLFPLTKMQIERSSICTHCHHPQVFHSYRRNQTPQRNFNLLMISSV